MTTAASSANNNANAALIAKQIAPWATLMQGLSPVKEKTKATNSKATPTPPAVSSSTFRPGHKRTMPPAPEPEPEPVFQPLHPAHSRAMFPPTLLKVPVSLVDNDDSIILGQIQERAPSSMMFGSRSSQGLRGSMGEYSGLLTPVFKHIDIHEHCAGNCLEFMINSGSYQAPELYASDPDSDMPDELCFILAMHSDPGSIVESLSYGDIGEAAMWPSSPADDMYIDAVPACLSGSGPPTIKLPVFCALLVDDEDNRCEIDEGANTSDEDTKKLFDFMGKLQKLNESGGSDRRSFIEQLENTFRTPAKVDLRYDFGVGTLLVEVPPVPELPVDFKMAVDAESSGSSNATSCSSDGNNSSSSGFDGYSSGSKLMEVKQPSLLEKTSRPEFDSMQDSKSRFDMFSASRIVDIKEPTMLQGSDSLSSSSTNETEDSLFNQISSPGLQPSPAASNHPSDGQLNMSFRFGGLPHMELIKSLPKDEEKLLTLSNIIPPPSHVRSLSESFNLDAFEDDSVLKSIYTKIVMDVPPARPRVNSDSSACQGGRNYGWDVACSDSHFSDLSAPADAASSHAAPATNAALADAATPAYTATPANAAPAVNAAPATNAALADTAPAVNAALADALPMDIMAETSSKARHRALGAPVGPIKSSDSSSQPQAEPANRRLHRRRAKDVAGIPAETQNNADSFAAMAGNASGVGASTATSAAAAFKKATQSNVSKTCGIRDALEGLPNEITEALDRNQ
ncbi:hypothetical protein BDZ97DRAFT_2075008 [Flammula alnicola]|nr:hypothetical protein BDZ97DRAFT_2075008 [Flammula alnicola]